MAIVNVTIMDTKSKTIQNKLLIPNFFFRMHSMKLFKRISMFQIKVFIKKSMKQQYLIKSE